jgi:nucleotide-binding universal stress UspA family protein
VSVAPQESATEHEVLSRVLCGVDGSAAGEEAVRQGARLRAPGGRLLLVSVASPASAPHPEVAAAVDRQAEDALRRAEGEAGGGSEPHLMVGDAEAGLLAVARDRGATLIAVGSHGTSRMGGILAGSVATAMLHRAPCSVLVARPPRDRRGFPARIAVGIDGSAPSQAALRLATDLGARFDAEVVAVMAGGVARAGVARPVIAGTVHVDDREPVEALLDVAATCDLLVVGARGLRGLRALGSVSERVAHRSSSSVLVLRGADVKA